MARSRRRKFVRIGLISLAALVLLVASAPWFANIGPVRRLAEKEIARILGHAVTVTEVEASWGGGVRVRGVIVPNHDPSFASARILDIGTVHLDMPLKNIVWGGAESTDVTITGMRLSIEEQGGGRINFTGLVPRLFPRRDARPRRPGAPPPPPINLSLRDCTIEIRHMARPSGDPIVDPFQADPVIRAASDGEVSVILESFDLDVTLSSRGSSLRYSGGLKIDGRGGKLTAELGADGADVRLEGFDIASLGRFFGRDLGGDMSLELSDRDGQFDLSATVQQFSCSLPAIREESVTVRAAMRNGAIESLTLENKAGDVRMNARGSVRQFHVEATAPRAFWARAQKKDVVEGTLSCSLDGGLWGRMLRVKGSVASRDGPRGTVTATLDVDYALDRRGLTVRSLALNAGRTSVRAKGTLTLGEPIACDLTGAVVADLALLQAEFGAYLKLDESFRVEGHANLPNARVVLGSGESEIKVSNGRIDNLRVRWDGGEITEAIAHIDVDATLTDNGNILDVAKCNVLGCELTGRIVGLKQKRPDMARVEGTVHLTPLIARLLKRPDMDLGGRLEIDVRTSDHELGLRIDGSVIAHDLRINDFHRDRLALKIEQGGYRGAQSKGYWFGDATLRGRNLHARLRLLRFDPRRDHLFAEVSLEEEAALADLALLFDLPDDIEFGGVIKPVVGVMWDRGTWIGHVVLERTKLTARRGGLGIHDEPVRFLGKVRHDSAGTRLFDAELNVGDIKIVPKAGVSKKGKWSADVQLKSMAQALRRCVPALEEIELGGRVVLDASLRDGRVFGTLNGTGIAMTIEDERIEVGEVVVNAHENGAFELKSGGASLSGTARFGRTLELKLNGGGKMPALAAWFPDGFVLKDLDCRIPLMDSKGSKGGGVARIDGRFSAGRVRIGSVRVFGLDMTPHFLARDVTHFLDTVRGGMWLKADAVSLPGFAIQGLEVDVADRDTKSKLSGLKYIATVTAKEFRAEGITVKGLALRQLTGLLADLTFLPRSFAALGPVTFDEAHALDRKFTKGRGRFAWWKRRLDLLAFEAHGKRGKLSVRPAPDGARTSPVNWIDLSDAVPNYRFDIAVKGIEIDKNLGRALNLAIPLLVTAKERDRTMLGTIDITVAGRGKGFDLDTIEDSLFATARIVMHDAEFEGSAALSLSGLQIGAAFDGRNYRFQTISVSPTFRDGLLRINPKQTLVGGRYQIGIKGTASLRGKLDYTVYASYFRLPITVKGTIDNPDVRLLGFIR